MSEDRKGFLCSAALAYPRAELPFIAEWLDYHLSLGVDQVFYPAEKSARLQIAESYLTLVGLGDAL